MSQISPPMRILLAGAIAFLAVWMLFLKPGPGTKAPSPTPDSMRTAVANDPNGPPAKTGLGRAVQKAHGASQTSDAANAAAGGTAGTAVKPGASTQTKPSTATTPKTVDPALAKLPTWLKDSIDKKVVAILFFNDNAADDRRTLAAFKRSYRAHGDVVARSVPVSEISRYGGVARGVDVQQSPTIVVIDRKRGANSLVGYSGLATINQAIVDGLLATDNPIEKVPYLQHVQAKCRRILDRSIVGVSDGATPRSYERNVDAVIASQSAALTDLRGAKVPAAYKPLSRQLNRYLASEVAANRQVKATAIRADAIDAIKARRAFAANDRLQGRTVLELNAVGVTSCNFAYPPPPGP